jgi:SNF2 family DNA or RNA helicase
MGLGKTIQTACFLEILTTTFQQRGPFLIVVPLSTMVNWQRELTRWTSLDVVVYYGSVDDRENAREHEFYYDVKNKKAGYKLEVVITTPETLTGNDSRNSSRIVRELAKIAWDVVVVDEAHKIKNHDSKFTSVLRDEFTFKACALLTGTPLQNAMGAAFVLAIHYRLRL